MSLTLVVWVVVLVALVVVAFKRPVFGFSLYLFTFFLFPKFWWWGRSLPDLRWNLFAGVLLILVTFLHRASDAGSVLPGRLAALLGLTVVNATAVHFLLAADPVASADVYILLLKFTLLLGVVTLAVTDRTDFRIALWSMVLGAAYLGWEVTINDRGEIDSGRLEGIGAAGVANANQLAALVATILPLTGGLFLTGDRREKLLAILTAPLILNVLLLCNSRGAFLASIAGGLVFIVCARGPAARKARQGLALGAVAIFLLLGDPDILQRFTSIFVSAEERDNSAASRLVFWNAAVDMIADHPLGAGGDGFAQGYGASYLGDLPARPIHNGYLTEAADWGVQGFALRMLLFGAAAALAWRTLRDRQWGGDGDAVILGACLLTALTAHLGTSMFGDYIDEEWGYWLVALLAAYGRLYGLQSVTPIQRAVHADEETLPSPLIDAPGAALHGEAPGMGRGPSS